MTSYPTEPTGDNIIDLTNIFASENVSKVEMSTAEILDGYNNDGETETPLTSKPDGNKFNYFWYQVHNTLAWAVSYINVLYTNKLETSGGTLSGALSMGSNKLTSLSDGTASADAVNKGQLDTAVSGAMWLSEVKYLAYPTIPTLPTGIEVVNADGRALSRTTYSTLFALIGTTYGIGDNSTTFNIPNLLGKYVVGWDSSGTLDAGRSFGTDQKRENSKYSLKYDYANTVPKNTNTTYTADTNGILFVRRSNGADSPILYLDGVTYDLGWTSSQGSGGSDFVPIIKGQTYNFVSGGYMKFIPEIPSTQNSTSTQTNIALYPVIRIK